MNRKKVCPIVSLCVHSKGYSTLSLTLHADLMICEPLLCQPVAATVKTNSHFEGSRSSRLTTREIEPTCIYSCGM